MENNDELRVIDQGEVLRNLVAQKLEIEAMYNPSEAHLERLARINSNIEVLQTALAIEDTLGDDERAVQLPRDKVLEMAQKVLDSRAKKGE